MSLVEKVLSKLPVGPRHIQMVKAWVPSACVFGIGAATGGLYLVDWKLVNQFIPFYGGKFKEEE